MTVSESKWVWACPPENISTGNNHTRLCSNHGFPRIGAQLVDDIAGTSSELALPRTPILEQRTKYRKEQLAHVVNTVVLQFDGLQMVLSA